MQSHIWDRTVATIVKQKLFFIHLRLSLFYLSLSSLHFFLLSSLSVLRRWVCSTDDCAPPMVMGRGLMCSSDFVGLDLWVWVHGSRFVSLGSWVWVYGSTFCGASTSRLAATIVGSLCIWKETHKLCQGTSQSTSKSWTRKALLCQDGTASLAITS